MKACDIFADNLNVGWPEFLIFVVFRIADNRQIIAERVNPNIHHLTVVTRHRNSPLQFFNRAADRNVFGAVFYQIQQLFAAKFWRHRGFDELADFICEFRNGQIIVILAEFLERFVVVRARKIHGASFALGDETFTANTVPTFISALVDHVGIDQFLPNLLDAANVLLVGSPNAANMIKIEIKFLAHFLKMRLQTIDEFLRSLVVLGGFFGDFRAMFVGANRHQRLAIFARMIAQQNIAV